MQTHEHLAAILLLTAIAAPVHAEVTSHPCRMALAQGFLEERRAQFPQALELFEQARREPLCEVEAQIGLARTFNSLNDHKEALIAAEWVLDQSDDPELLAEAHYEIGRALHKPGRRLTKDKTAAEVALLQAVELSEGRHRGAVRALLRLYQETRRDDRLAELQERFPDVRASTRAQQLRAVAPQEKAAAAAAEEPRPALAEASVDCTSREGAPSASWKLDLPRFCGDGSDADGRQRPAKISSPAPEYTEEDRNARTQGAVEFEALVGVDGEVEAVRIVAGLSPGLDTATAAAICRWRFEPARDAEGLPTRFYVCSSANFRLR